MDDFDLQAEIVRVKEMLHETESKVMGIQSRLDQLIASHNQVGENIAWLTANTQGIFQMLNNPELMSKMMGGLLSGGPMGMMGGAFSDKSDSGPAESPGT